MRTASLIGIGLLVAPLTALPAAAANETISYTYDALGRIQAVAHSGSVNNGVQESYAHDLADNRSTVIVTGSSFSGNTVIVVPLNGLTIIPIPSPSSHP